MPNFSEALAEQVRSNPRFAQAYQRLQVASLSDLTGKAEGIDAGEARKLAQSAVIFAQDGSVSMQGLAQDIAYALVQTSQDELVRAACTQVLNSIGNFPAGNFVSRRGSAIADVLPWTMKLETLGREHRNTVEVHDKPTVLAPAEN